MVRVIQASEQELGSLAARRDFLIEPQSEALVPAKEEAQGAGFFESAQAAVVRENTVLDILRKTGVTTETPQGPQFTPPGPWNPYTYIQLNWSEEDKETYRQQIGEGLFDNTMDAQDVETRKAQLASEMELLKAIEGGNAWGVVGGSLVGALTDPVTYTPMGALAKIKTATRLGKTLKGVLLGSAAGAVPEGILQYNQDLRTATESFMNIGIGGVLGGGVGALSHAALPSSRLNPAHPENPLNPKNLDGPGEVYRTVDGRADSIGAARYEGPQALPGIASNIPVLRNITKFVEGVTPAGRAMHAASGKAREAYMKLMDLGGRLTTTDVDGRAIIPAEAIKNDLLAMGDEVFRFADAVLHNLNVELGSSQRAMSVGFGFRLKDTEFANITRRKLDRVWSEADERRLVEQYGDDAPKIEAAADKYANKIHETNDYLQQELIDIGMIRDPAKVTKLEGQIKAVRDQIKQAKAQSIEGVEAPDLPKLRQQRDELLKQHSVEIGKPEGLGRDYGHAQLWDPSVILANPGKFDEMISELLVTRPDVDWLLTEKGLTQEDFDKLGIEEVEVGGATLSVEQGAQTRKDILDAWTGDEWAYKIGMREAEVAAREADSKAALRDLRDVLIGLGLAKRQVGQLSLSQARKTRDALNASVNAAGLSKEARLLFRDAVADAAKAARVSAAERAALKGLSADAVAELEAAVEKAERRLFVTIADSLKDPGTAGRVTESGEFVRAQKTLSDAEARLRVAVESSPEVSSRTNARLSKFEERAKGRQKQLEKAERRLKKLEETRAHYEAKLQDVEARFKAAKSAHQGLQDSLKDFQKAKKVADKDLRKAKKALARQRKATPLWQVVEDVRNNLVSRKELPRPMMEHIVPENGRLKARRFNFTPEQRAQFEEAGFLRTDLTAILHTQYSQLSGQIALRKALDLGPGRTYGNWEDFMRRALEDYDGTDGAERELVRKDLNTLKDRLLGTENSGADPDEIFHWLSGKVRLANFVRHGPGFLVASITDAASVFLRTGSLAKLLKTHGRDTIKLMQKVYEENPEEILAMVNATELGTQGVRMAKALDADDALARNGIGARGTLKHTITSNTDQAFGWMSDKVNLVSGMRAWNRFWKITAGLHRAHRIRDLVGKYDELDELTAADLTSLGIGREEAARIAKQIELHSKTSAEDGFWDLNFSDWMSTKEGREAARDFRMAVQRDMNRAVFTPGIGDQPRVMSSAMGKLWLQYQTFGFTFFNRFMAPASQRIANYKDMQAMAAFAHLAWSGLMVVLLKDVINGRDPTERLKPENWAHTTYEIVDRSGITGYLSPYIDSALKVPLPATGNATLGDALGLEPSSRYSRNNWLSSLGGPTVGLIQQIQETPGALSSGDAERIRKKLINLAPFSAFLKITNNILASE